MELETRLRDKEAEVEQLRKALAKAGIKQEEVPVRFDGVSRPPCPPPSTACTARPTAEAAACPSTYQGHA